MVKHSRMTFALLGVPLIALIAAAGIDRPAAAGSERQCPSACGTKIEQGPWTYTGDKVITGVCIKAGTGRFGFNKDGSDGCYTVTGLGTSKVVVSGGGTGRNCKDISNVVFYFACDGGGIGSSS